MGLAVEMHLGVRLSEPAGIFLDLLSVRASGFNPKGRLPGVPMLKSPENLEDAINVIANITPLIKKEANQEIVFRLASR